MNKTLLKQIKMYLFNPKNDDHMITICTIKCLVFKPAEVHKILTIKNQV